MNFPTLLRAAGLLSLPVFCLPVCRAGLETFTTTASFNAAVASGFQPLTDATFDDLTPGVLPSGSTADGITFNYSLSGGLYQMEVTAAYATTSGTNSLGSTGDNSFLAGDQFTMTFAQPEQAVGLYVLTAGPNDPGDFALSVTQGSVPTSGNVDPAFNSVPGLNPNEGTWVYFLGLVETDPTQSFTTATLTSIDGGGFPFNVDDVFTTVQMPNNNGGNGGNGGGNSVPDAASTLALLLCASAGLFSSRRRLA